MNQPVRPFSLPSRRAFLTGMSCASLVTLVLTPVPGLAALADDTADMGVRASPDVVAEVTVEDALARLSLVQMVAMMQDGLESSSSRQDNRVMNRTLGMCQAAFMPLVWRRDNTGLVVTLDTILQSLSLAEVRSCARDESMPEDVRYRASQYLNYLVNATPKPDDLHHQLEILARHLVLLLRRDTPGLGESILAGNVNWQALNHLMVVTLESERNATA